MTLKLPYLLRIASRRTRKLKKGFTEPSAIEVRLKVPGKVTIKEAYDIYSSQIKKEDDLINQRMTFGLTMNVALFTIFVAFFSIISSTIEPKSHEIVMDALLFLPPAMGIIMSYMTKREIYDARYQLRYLIEKYQFHWQEEFEVLSDLPRPFGWPTNKNGGKLPSSWPDGKLGIIIISWSIIVFAIIYFIFVQIYPSSPTSTPCLDNSHLLLV